ncbi:MAG: hypothetical protein NZ805_03455 [Armatimonadetes bacterium]|nr:hypothetical protein [Armatimonadota bacterium]MDW8028095.1 hypothetical protein [Armatimonadota bacterium]
MKRWFRLTILQILLASVSSAQNIGNGHIQIYAVGEKGRFFGFAIQPVGRRNPIATIRFGSLDNIFANSVQVRKEKAMQVLRFSPIIAEPTPELDNSSFVEVRLLADYPYPQVRFKLQLRSFSPSSWQENFGQVPFHFLVCSLVGAEIFHQRGWMIGTPVIDRYILLDAGPTNFVQAQWSKGWSYAPPFGAYPLPVVGLWKPSSRAYIAYEFVTARLNDHSERYIASAYCWEMRDGKRNTRRATSDGRREFFALVFPYAIKGFRWLRYPQGNETIESHFRILWHTNLTSTDDPNRFVHQWLWQTFADKLPSAPIMNEFGWLPKNLRLASFPKPALGDLLVVTGEENPFQKLGNIAAIGVDFAAPVVDYQFITRNESALKRLRHQLDQLVNLSQRFNVNGDRCIFWQKPIKGDWRDHYGKGVPTLRNVQGFQVAQAFLDAIRNGWREPRYLEVVDGAVRWAKHFLYTRNCYDDVPDAQFAWSAAPIAHFLFAYHYAFRNDPDQQRRNLAMQAKDLAHAIVYRYMTLFPCDNDPFDEIDASFFMEPNAGYPWLGSACANEIWAYAHALLEAYVITGDPILGHYLRGMTEKWHLLMRDEWHPSIADYVNAFAEMFGLFDGVAVGRSKRSTFGGLWGGFEQLAYPVGESQMRVVCGEGAAMAFNKVGIKYDIADYRFEAKGEGQGSQVGLSFQVVAIVNEAQRDEISVMVTVPHFDLRNVTVKLRRNGQKVSLQPEQVVTFLERPDTILVRNVKVGDEVIIGEVQPNTPIRPCQIAKKRKLSLN